MPEISIIIPVYKTEAYIRRCMDSILSQTFTDFEVILVDDGSPDGCPSICDEYAGKDNRVHVIHQVNGGASTARNRGLDSAVGNYVTFVDSDDWVASRYLEHLWAQMQKYPDCCCVSVFTSAPKCLGMTSPQPMIEPGIHYEPEKDFERIFRSRLIGYTCGRMFVRTKIEHLHLRFRSQANGDYNEDLLFALTYLQHCSGVCYTGYADYLYFTHEGSLSRGAYGKNYWIKYLEKFHFWKEVILRYGTPELLPELADDTIYHLLLYVQGLVNRQWFPKKSFFACFSLDGYDEMLASVVGARENPKLLTLLRKKRHTTLWWYLKLSQIAGCLKK